MNTQVLFALGAIVLLAIGVLLYVVWQLKARLNQPQDNQALGVMMEWMKEIKQGTDSIREGTQQSLNETNKAINERLDNAAKVISLLQRELGQLSQVQQNIGPDIKRLTETLANSKMRGNFGEELLENLLQQVLPQGGFEAQYRFKSGEVVDAVVWVGEERRMLSVDSKFSLENFRLLQEAGTPDSQDTLRKAFLKDVKKRIDEIHKKYILPQEGTLEYAVMFVPGEGVFQEISQSSEASEYARSKQIFMAGPNSLHLLLKSILISLRGQQMNKAAGQLLNMISGMKKESDKFGDNLDKLSVHIKNAGNMMGTVSTDFMKLRGSIENAANLQVEAKPEPDPLLTDRT